MWLLISYNHHNWFVCKFSSWWKWSFGSNTTSIMGNKQAWHGYGRWLWATDWIDNHCGMFVVSEKGHRFKASTYKLKFIDLIPSHMKTKEAEVILSNKGGSNWCKFVYKVQPRLIFSIRKINGFPNSIE